MCTYIYNICMFTYFSVDCGAISKFHLKGNTIIVVVSLLPNPGIIIRVSQEFRRKNFDNLSVYLNRFLRQLWNDFDTCLAVRDLRTFYYIFLLLSII